jgi:outer membrane lipoprotein-sorting protein
MPQPTRRTALVILAASTLLAGPAMAAPADDPLVARTIGYLDGLSSVKGRFQQTNEKGGEADGTFYLARPGRARFEYDPPSGLLITCDGQTVTVTDTRRGTSQHLPLSSLPLAVFLSDHIRLDRGAQVTRIDRSAAGFSITARGPQAAAGQITLYFSDGPLRLIGWAVVDAQSRVTRVSLGPLQPISPPPNGFFAQTGH